MDLKAKKIRATFFFLIVIGLLILSSSVLVHKAISDQLLGRRDRVGVSDFIPFWSNRNIKGVSAAVLISHQTARYLSTVSSDDTETQNEVYDSYKEQAEFWHNHLRNKNYQSTIINDQELLHELYKYNLLILPFTLCLSESQISAVKEFLELGKGVIFTHSSGNRDENGEERAEWSLTSDVLGGRPFYPAIDENTVEVSYTLISPTPLTVNTPPGWKTEIYTYDQPMAINLVETRAQESAHWRVVRQLDESEFSSVSHHTAVAYGNYTRGRFVWMGFNPSGIIEAPDVWLHFDRLLDSAVHWVTYRAVAGKPYWLTNKAAATFVVVPQRDYVRALALNDLFLNQNIKPAFLVDSNQASFYRRILEQISSNSEISAQVSDLFVPSAVSRAEIERKARAAKSSLEDILNRRISGFGAENDRILNYETIGRMGYEYVWLWGEEGSIPSTKRTNVQSLFRKRRDTVTFYQSGRSDALLLEQYNNPTPDKILEELKKDFNETYRTGGLYTLTLHTHLLGSERYQPILNQFLEYIKKRDVYIASPEDIARFWRKYDNLTIRIEETSRRINLMITNESRDMIDSSLVFLYPAVLPTSLSIRAERIHVPIPEYTFNREKTRIDLEIRNMHAGESRTYSIDFR